MCIILKHLWSLDLFIGRNEKNKMIYIYTIIYSSSCTYWGQYVGPHFVCGWTSWRFCFRRRGSMMNTKGEDPNIRGSGKVLRRPGKVLNWTNSEESRVWIWSRNENQCSTNWYVIKSQQLENLQLKEGPGQTVKVDPPTWGWIQDGEGGRIYHGGIWPGKSEY